MATTTPRSTQPPPSSSLGNACIMERSLLPRSNIATAVEYTPITTPHSPKHERSSKLSSSSSPPSPPPLRLPQHHATIPLTPRVGGMLDHPLTPPSPTQTPTPIRPHTRGCSVAMLVLLSLPRMAINMAWAAQWAALGPYLGTLLPRFAVQLTQVIGPLTGILVAPTIGVLSDRCRHPWGRRRPFLLFGAVTSACCWTLMGFTREIGLALGDHGSSNRWTAVFTVIFYTWMDITVNVVQTPAFLIIADFAGDRQTLGAGIGQASSTLGALIVAGYIQCFGAAHLTLHWFLGMLSLTMLVSVGLVCAVAKEEPWWHRAQALDEQEERKEDDKDKELDHSHDHRHSHSYRHSHGAEGSCHHTAETDRMTTRERVVDALASIVRGLRTLPPELVAFSVIFFCAMYGFTAYNGSKGQFFGIEVFGGDPTASAVACSSLASSSSSSSSALAACSEKVNESTRLHDQYDRGVQLAGGFTDLGFNLMGYAYSWTLPWLLARLGARWLVPLSMVPQALLMVMAFSRVVALNVGIVVLTSVTQATLFALLVPILLHVLGERADVGMYVGAINSANCLGQLLNFLAGAALVQTVFGYKLPVFVGGAMSLVAVVVSLAFFRIKMYAM